MIITKTTALILAMSSILGIAPIAAVAQLQQDAVIDDSDTNTQVNSATVVQTQGDGDFNTQASFVEQGNALEDNDANAIIQTQCQEVFFC
jgi:hypothetical protein